jgi:hypothetical protein
MPMTSVRSNIVGMQFDAQQVLEAIFLGRGAIASPKRPYILVMECVMRGMKLTTRPILTALWLSSQMIFAKDLVMPTTNLVVIVQCSLPNLLYVEGLCSAGN